MARLVPRLAIAIYLCRHGYKQGAAACQAKYDTWFRWRQPEYLGQR